MDRTPAYFADSATVEHPLDDEQLEPSLDLRALARVRVHPRLLLAAMLVSVGMTPLGIVLAALGVKVLDWSGGAAHDTSVVVGIAGYLVTDFWGGGLVTTLTRARPPQVAVAWAIARTAILLVALLITNAAFGVLVAQLALAIPAAWAGARTARKQAALRRHVEAERRAREAGEGADAVDAEAVR